MKLLSAALRVRPIVFLLLVLLVPPLSICLLVFAFIQNDDRVGDDSEYISSSYNRYQGRIYADIAFQGYYLLPDADATSFQALPPSTRYPLGKDDKAVYCGTRRIPGLSPVSIQFASDGYVSDGHNAWFCSLEKDNPDYHWWQELLPDRQCSDCPGKPRLRDFFLTKLQGVNASALKTIAFEYAYDDLRIYYQGLAIPGSDSRGVQQIVRGFGTFKGRESDEYLRDGKHVYFEGQALEGADPARFTEWVAESSRQIYGLDSSSGQFYIGATPLPSSVNGVDSSHLQPLLFDGSRGHHELFINAQGIWYWDYQDEQFKQACNNPFTPSLPVKSLAPGVWADGHDTYVSRSAEIWRTGRNDQSLKWRMSQLIRLPGIAASDWKKVEDLKRDIWSQGQLWQAKGRDYFFPDAGNGHGFNDALYAVSDLPLLRRMTTEPEFLGDKAMNALQSLDDLPGTSVACEARSYYPGQLGF